MARPLVSGTSSLCEIVGTAPLNAAEQDSGELALAAYLYEQGAELTGSQLVFLWLAGIGAPRAAQKAKEMAKDRAAAKNAVIEVKPT